MVINNVLFFKFNTEDFIEFCKQIFPLVEKLDVEILGLSRPYAKVTNAFNILNEKFKSSDFSPCDSFIINADCVRSEALTAIQFYLMACQRKMDQRVRVSARILIEALNKFEWQFHHDNYDKESEKIRKFLSAISYLSQLKEAIDILNLDPWINELENAQKKFESALKNRVEDMSKDNGMACRDIRNSLNLIFLYINIMQQIQPNHLFSEIIASINNVINNFNSEVRSRKTEIEN